MRHGTSNRRSRNRGNGGRRGNQNRSQVFDSNGPDVRIRGTAHQIHEKYIALAKDAHGSGDLILAESYQQHAEHYMRVINSWNDDKPVAAADDNETAGHQKDQKRTKRSPQSQSGDDLGLPESIVGEKKTDNADTSELEDA